MSILISRIFSGFAKIQILAGGNNLSFCTSECMQPNYLFTYITKPTQGSKRQSLDKTLPQIHVLLLQAFFIFKSVIPKTLACVNENSQIEIV